MEITAACRAFCVESREWTEGAVAPMVLGVAHAASAVLGGRLYVAGGVYTEGLRRGLEDESDLLQVYDVQTGWSASKIDLPSDAFFGLFPGSRAALESIPGRKAGPGYLRTPLSRSNRTRFP